MLPIHQGLEFRESLVDNTLDIMKFPSALWKRDASHLLIRQWFSIDMPILRVERIPRADRRFHHYLRHPKIAYAT